MLASGSVLVCLGLFVDIRARVASSMYGRDYANANKTKQQDKPSESKQKREKQPKPTISTLLTTSTAHKDTPAAKPSENKHYQSASVSPSIPASDRPVCANCETPGHTIERCFKFKAPEPRRQTPSYQQVISVLLLSQTWPWIEDMQELLSQMPTSSPHLTS